jgi:hypothetical protein
MRVLFIVSKKEVVATTKKEHTKEFFCRDYHTACVTVVSVVGELNVERFQDLLEDIQCIFYSDWYKETYADDCAEHMMHLDLNELITSLVKIPHSVVACYNDVFNSDGKEYYDAYWDDTFLV